MIGEGGLCHEVAADFEATFGGEEFCRGWVRCRR